MKCARNKQYIDVRVPRVCLARSEYEEGRGVLLEHLGVVLGDRQVLGRVDVVVVVGKIERRMVQERHLSGYVYVQRVVQEKSAYEAWIRNKNEPA